MLDFLGNRTVNETTSDNCGKDISPDEIEQTCVNLPAEKSPGPDRIPYEFYKIFAKLLSPLLARFFNDARRSKKIRRDSTTALSSCYTKKVTVGTSETTDRSHSSIATTKL